MAPPSGSSSFAAVRAYLLRARRLSSTSHRRAHLLGAPSLEADCRRGMVPSTPAICGVYLPPSTWMPSMFLAAACWLCRRRQHPPVNAAPLPQVLEASTHFPRYAVVRSCGSLLQCSLLPPLPLRYLYLCSPCLRSPFVAATTRILLPAIGVGPLCSCFLRCATAHTCTPTPVPDFMHEGAIAVS